MVTDAVVNSTMFQKIKYISCYLSMPRGELDTGPLVAAILAAGSHLFSSQQETDLQGSSFQEKSFTSQSWTPRTRLSRGWTCSACTTSPISIHSRQDSGVSVNPRAKETANHGRTVGLRSPHSCRSWPLDIFASALDADQRLDLIIVPGECLLRVEYTSHGNGD